MKTLKDYISEGVLGNVEDILKDGDNQTKFGNFFNLIKCYGEDDVLLCTGTSKYRTAIDGLKPFSDVDAVINDLEKYVGMYGLGKAKKLILTNIITAIENFSIPAVKDLNDKKFKTELTAAMTDSFHALGLLPSTARFHNENKFGGDARGVFQLHIEYRYNTFTFLYEIK